MKVLVVEDDAKLSGFIQKGLEAEGFVVDLCSDGDEGYSLATTREYDAMVLDIMLPGRDGLSILRNLREKRIETPVIVLTARGSLNERLDGLKLGADDYMMKPFFVEELAARLHVVARRASGVHGCAGLSIAFLFLKQILTFLKEIRTKENVLLKIT